MLLAGKCNLIFIVNRALTTPPGRPGWEPGVRHSKGEFDQPSCLTGSLFACVVVGSPAAAPLRLHFRDPGMFMPSDWFIGRDFMCASYDGIHLNLMRGKTDRTALRIMP